MDYNTKIEKYVRIKKIKVTFSFERAIKSQKNI